MRASTVKSARCAPSASSEFTTTVTPTDYAQSAHWLALPSSPDKEVDVFYIYPTAYHKGTSIGPLFCEVDNSQMIENAKSVFSSQATAFEQDANIYAPYYRQVDSQYQLNLSFTEQDLNIRFKPLVDVTAAFEYYLQNYNNGRPFILAAHSQGSAVLKDLLSDYMKTHPDVYERMIVSYVVGQSITREYLAQNSHLTFATGSDDTGVIVSWNTEAPVVDGKNPVTMPGGIAINPITWTTGEVKATAEQSLGAIQLDPTTGKPERDKDGQLVAAMDVADACVDKQRGVVVCTTLDAVKYSSPGLPKGVFHNLDYALYFFDIRANAKTRIEKYLTGNKNN